MSGHRRAGNGWRWSRELTLALVAGLAAGPLAATTYTVTTKTDAVAADGQCTLREAIRAADRNLASADCPAGEANDSIVLASTEAGSYLFASGHESVLGGGSLTLRGDLSLPASSHVIDLAAANRFLLVFPGQNLTLENLWLLSGRAPAGMPYGGALLVFESQLVLSDVAIYASTAQFGGALYYDASDDGTLRLVRTTFEGNLATDGSGPGEPTGGAIWAQVIGGSSEILDSRFYLDEARTEAPSPSAGRAGAMHLILLGTARFAIRRSRFEANAARRDVGGLAVRTDPRNPGTAELLIEDSDFVRNSVTGFDLIGGVTGALYVETIGQNHVALSRLRVSNSLLGGSVTGSFTQAVVSARGTSVVEVADLLIEGTSGRGLQLATAEAAALTAGHLTVTGNRGTGLLLAASGTGAVRLENSILWNNGLVSPDDLDTVSTTPSFDPVANHNLIGEMAGPNPEFVDAAGGNYELTAGSPAIDSGDRAFATVGALDLAGRPRVYGPETDLGAFESQPLFWDDLELGVAGRWSARTP